MARPIGWPKTHRAESAHTRLANAVRDAGREYTGGKRTPAYITADAAGFCRQHLYQRLREPGTFKLREVVGLVRFGVPIEAFVDWILAEAEKE